MPQSARPLEVFFSYSHRDEKLYSQLENHLAMLKHEGVIQSWHDRRIGAGKEWEGQIDEHLNSANVILLLISSYFLASDYCYGIELKRAMERHEAGEARVIPIILRVCDWTSAPFGKLQALPKDAKPVKKWADQDQAFADIAIGIRKVVEELLVNIPDNNPLFPTNTGTSINDSAIGSPSINRLRNKLMTLQQLEQEELIDESTKKEYQHRLLDGWIDED